MSKYEMRFIGDLKWFLGIRIVHDHKQWKIWLCQDSYIEKITNLFNLQYLKSSWIPMIPEKYNLFEGKASLQDVYLYQ